MGHPALDAVEYSEETMKVIRGLVHGFTEGLFGEIPDPMTPHPPQGSYNEIFSLGRRAGLVTRNVMEKVADGERKMP